MPPHFEAGLLDCTENYVALGLDAWQTGRSVDLEEFIRFYLQLLKKKNEQPGMWESTMFKCSVWIFVATELFFIQRRNTFHSQEKIRDFQTFAYLCFSFALITEIKITMR